MCLKRIISGGQTGIDQISLELAQKYGFETGGYVPKGFLTETGNDYSLKTRFGLEELPISSYIFRTKMNVCKSDGVVVFGDVNGANVKLTIKTANELKSPILINPTSKEELLIFIEFHNIAILNVTGTRGSKLTPDTYNHAIKILSEVLEKLKS